MRKLTYAILSLMVLIGCTDVYEDPLPEYESELIIEAYVNQANPLLNYALLTKSLPYYNENFEVDGIDSAKVTLFEGQKQGTELIWDEEGLEYIEFEEIPGLYLPPITEFFVGKEGFFYKLEVEYDGVKSTSVTQIPNLVPIDSIWVDQVFNPNRDTLEPFLRFLFTDPPKFGNNYLIAESINAPSEWPVLWGSADRIVVTDDGLFNNEPFVYSPIFPDSYGDTVNMYLISIDEETRKYWESYDASRNNGGPFTQPINVNSTFDNARGTFQGMAVDNRRIVIK